MAKSKRVTQPKRVLWRTPSASPAGKSDGYLESLRDKDGGLPRTGRRVYNPKDGKHIVLTLDRQAKMVEMGLLQENPAEDGTSDQLTLFAEVSPVSPIVSPANKWGLMIRDGFGLSSSEFLAFYDPASSSWRTYQVSLLSTEDLPLERYSGTWPASGTMWNGRVYQRQPLVPRTSATEFSLWPTPMGEENARSSGGSNLLNPRGIYQGHPLATAVKWVAAGMWPTPSASPEKMGWPRKGETGRDLQAAVRGAMWPTPRTTDSHGAGEHGEGGPDLRTAVGGQLNPTWVEWLMGFPLGWTVLEHWGTRSSRKSRSGSGGESSRR